MVMAYDRDTYYKIVLIFSCKYADIYYLHKSELYKGSDLPQIAW